MTAGNGLSSADPIDYTAIPDDLLAAYGAASDAELVAMSRRMRAAEKRSAAHLAIADALGVPSGFVHGFALRDELDRRRAES